MRTPVSSRAWHVLLVPPDAKLLEQDCQEMKKKGGPPGPAGKVPLRGTPIH